MCGRFALTATTKDIEKLLPGFNADNPFNSRHNIAPTQNIVTALSSEPTLLQEVKWGLIPSWSKDFKIASKMINARAETLSEKPSFRQLINRKRCLIFADAFYEWKTIPESKKKIPHIIYFKDGISLSSIFKSFFGFLLLNKFNIFCLFHPLKYNSRMVVCAPDSISYILS